MNTITLNEALKQRVYDSVAISEITASSLNADTGECPAGMRAVLGFNLFDTWEYD